MWNGPLEKVDEFTFRIPRKYRGDMRNDGILFSSDRMIDAVKSDEACEQVANVATLPGLAGPSMAMPDVHWGYGFPIGGVAATLVDEGGVISPGGVGFDINCGVRLLVSDLDDSDVIPHRKKLADRMFENVPSGVGSKARIRVDKRQLNEILTRGAEWAVEEGYGWGEDLLHLEEGGNISGAEPEHVSEKAKKRGLPQVGSLGAGNHFLEVQSVDEIYDHEAARAMGIERTGQVTVLIHTGSRGLGYQVCQDQVNDLSSRFRKDGSVYRSDDWDFSIPDRQLVAAPLGSREADSYLGAMRSAANYAWTNRQLITHWVRRAFSDVLGPLGGEADLRTVYDIAHNIAKIEEHVVDGRRRKVCVHRKGATRAFGPGHDEIPEGYRSFGQPVLIPGDMGTASYLMVGTQKAMDRTFGSTCHGAGRVLSRSKATRQFSSGSVISSLADRGIYLRANSPKVISEEAPGAYKDIDEVIRVADGAGISRKVARMVPIAVVKG